MEEDEEVVLENSHMHNFLHENGFLKIETKSVYSPNTKKHNVLLTAHPVQKSGYSSNDYIVTDEILAIKATNLLFEDDLNHIDYVLSNIELKNDHLLRHIFKGSSCAIVIFVGLCLYLILGVYAIFFVSIYYTYRTSDYLWNKHKRLTLLETLIEALKSNMFLLNKILKFVHENDNLVKLRLGGDLNGIAVKNLLTLKNSFVQHQIKFNKVLVNATNTLLQDVPLLEEIDDADKYLCNSIECNSNTESNSELHNRYMLLQSQFLARLAFSLVPCLHSYPKSNELVYKTMYKLMAHLQDLNASLNTKFTFTLMNGFYPDQNKNARPLDNPKPERSTSEEMLVRNVHDLSNSLQYSLIKARELELTLERRENVKPECELEAIQKELILCQSHIADLLILQKKSSTALVNHERSAAIDAEGCEFLTTTELGYSDLDPKVEDDIFEAIINETVDASIALCCDGEDLIDPLAKKKRKQVLVELKDRLKDKAEEWLERETLVRKRKGLPLPDETGTTSQEGSLSSSDCSISTRRKNYRERYGDSSSEEEFEYKPSIEFQRALLQTRQAFVDQTEHYDWDGSEDEN